MHNVTKIALIIAVACLLVGGILVTVSLVRTGLDFSSFQTSTLETRTYTPTEAFTDLYIDDRFCDIELRSSTDSSVRVVCTEDESCKHTVSVQSGTLRITVQDQRPWYAHIGIFMIRWHPKVVVYLPAQTYQSLYIKTLSGDIQLVDPLHVSEAELQTTSGDISARAEVQRKLIVQSTSGSIRLDRITCSSLEVETTSGDIDLLHMTATDSVSVGSTSGDVTLQTASLGAKFTCKTTSGEIELSDLSAESLSVKSTSGDIELRAVLIDGHAELQAVSGDIGLEHADAKTFWIKTTSGEVEGSLVTGKVFSVTSSSGRIRVPNSDTHAGLCEIKTTSGNVTITVDSAS